MHKFDTDRLAAFSDGVFAIAITLLVLELDLPTGTESSVGKLILADTPKLLAWVISFLAIGALWLHHHYILSQLQSVDIAVLLLNLALLLFISVAPWTTSLISAYGDQPISVIFFSTTLGAAWLSITLIAIVARNRGLLRPNAPAPEPGLTTTLVSIRGTLIAILSIGLAYIDTSLAVLVWVA